MSNQCKKCLCNRCQFRYGDFCNSLNKSVDLALATCKPKVKGSEPLPKKG